jgi:hypothetical protein
MAILVRPRRRIVWGSVLFLVVALGMPCYWWALGWTLGGDSQAPRPREPPDASSVLLWLAAGVLSAGVFGGISRGIARWHRCDMLAVFFGGVIGAWAAWMLCGCGAFALVLLMHGGGPEPPSGAFGAIQLGVIIGALLGFCLGASVVGQLSRSRH